VLISLFLAVFTYLLTLTPTIKIAERPWGTAPFRWVYFHVPGASAFRAPGRWSLAFALPLALLVALGASALADRLGRWRRAVLTALLAAMIELNVFPLPWARIPPTPPACGWLAAQPDDFAVLELPLAAGASGAQAMFWAANTHWKRLVNGRGGFPLAMTNEIVATMRPVFDPSGFAQIVRPSDRPVALRCGPSGAAAANGAPPGRTTPRFSPRRAVRFGQRLRAHGHPGHGIDFRRHFSSDFSSDFARTHPTAEVAVRFEGDDPDVK
jgi:hypothetical protein